MEDVDFTIQQMNRGPFEGKWFCHRNEGMEYFHSDGSWKMVAGETAYFVTEEEIEALMDQLDADAEQAYLDLQEEQTGRTGYS